MIQEKKISILGVDIIGHCNNPIHTNMYINLEFSSKLSSLNFQTHLLKFLSVGLDEVRSL